MGNCLQKKRSFETETTDAAAIGKMTNAGDSEAGMEMKIVSATWDEWLSVLCCQNQPGPSGPPEYGYCNLYALRRSTTYIENIMKMKFIRAASIDNSSSWQTAKLPEILYLIPSGFSLLFCFLCSITNHTNMLVMADESMTKQRCTIIQIKLWDICFYLCVFR